MGESQATTETQTSQPPEPPVHDPPPHIPQDAARRNPPSGPRNAGPIYQQAMNQVLPSSSPSSQKRTASARSPSPGGHPPNKARRMDVPVGPRAMLRDGGVHSGSGGRSLADRIGGAAPGHMQHQPHQRNSFSRNDDIQARIDNITSGSQVDPAVLQAAIQGGFMPNSMDMSGMMGANPLMLQEMMMNQMALMAQMANSLGMMNGGGFGPQGFQGMQQQDMGMFGQQGMNGFQQGGPVQQQQQQHHIGGASGRGRGTGKGGRGRNGVSAGGHDHAGHQQQSAEAAKLPFTEPRPSAAVPIVAPTPTLAESQPQLSGPTFAVPERPQSPTLCKFGMKCTNAHCRWAHPSPVATDQTGVVLSNEACEAGKNCIDKDCVKGHISPAAVNPALGELFVPPPLYPFGFQLYHSLSVYLHQAVEHPPKNATPASTSTSSPAPCRYGASCTKQATGCPYQHPSSTKFYHFSQQCRFGAGCTRATCPFQHPEGRVLPGTFHRGLSATGPIVNISTPPTGSMGAPSHNRSVTFNNAGSGAASSRASTEGLSEKVQLEKKMKELEDKKSEAEKKVKEAEKKVKEAEDKAAASGKKPAVALTA